jgi:hypothetical protein
MLSTGRLTFTPLDWNVPQVVTVTGINDRVDDGDKAYTITASVSSADSRYQGMVLPDVAITNVAFASDPGPDPDPGPGPGPEPKPVPAPVPPPPVPPPPIEQLPPAPLEEPQAPVEKQNEDAPIVVEQPHSAPLSSVPGVPTQVDPAQPDNPPVAPQQPSDGGGQPTNPGQPNPGQANPGGNPPQPPVTPDGGAPTLPIARAASPSLVVRLDAMARQMGSRGTREPMTVRAVKHTFVAITVGYVVWSLRGASLLASLLTSMPLWRSLDPLPILENRSALAKKKKRWWFSRRGRGAYGDQPLGELVK